MLNLTKTKEKLNECIIFLEDTQMTELSYALVNLFKTIVFEIEGVNNRKTSLAEEALCVRNVIELYLISKYIYKDNNNVKKWILQIHSDTEDIINGFLKLAIKNNMIIKEQRLQEIKTQMNLLLASSGYKSEKNFNIRAISKELGYADDYDSLYKLSCKIIHPSSMRVNHENYQSISGAFKEILVVSLQNYCSKLTNFADEIMNNDSFCKNA